MADDDRRVFDVRERGFEGQVVIEGGRVHVSGTRSDEETAVAKDVPVDRDPRLAELVERCTSGESGGPADLLAHLGVLDPA